LNGECKAICGPNITDDDVEVFRLQRTYFNHVLLDFSLRSFFIITDPDL
jgi:hypothetical protein